jgi:hypothetical protein
MKADYLFLGPIIAREAFKHVSAIFNYHWADRPPMFLPYHHRWILPRLTPPPVTVMEKQMEKMEKKHLLYIILPQLKRGVAALAKSHLDRNIREK